MQKSVSPRRGSNVQSSDKFAGLPVKSITYSNGATFEGQVNPMNQRHGKGVLKFRDNEAIYDGFFEDGVMTQGRMTYPNAAQECWFEGTFMNNQWDKGRYKKGPAIYEGTFDSQTMNGYFKVEWETNGIRYEGQVKANKLHGEGEMSFENGNI